MKKINNELEKRINTLRKKVRNIEGQILGYVENLRALKDQKAHGEISTDRFNYKWDYKLRELLKLQVSRNLAESDIAFLVRLRNEKSER